MIIERYHNPEKGWPTPGGLPVEMCDEARRELSFLFDTMSGYLSMDEYPDVDAAFHKLYIALMHLELRRSDNPLCDK